MVSVHLQPYGCSFTWQRKAANAVPVEPCILRHQWSAETLNGPISIFHLPSYDNKICRAQHNKHSEYPTSLLVTSPNRDIRTDEAPKPNGSFERAGSRLTWFVPSAPLLHWFLFANDFTHTGLCTLLAHRVLGYTFCVQKTFNKVEKSRGDIQHN